VYFLGPIFFFFGEMCYFWTRFWRVVGGLRFGCPVSWRCIFLVLGLGEGGVFSVMKPTFFFVGRLGCTVPCLVRVCSGGCLVSDTG
jgi:hypothetical protein